MIDSQLISFLQGLGIKFPENVPDPRSFLLQLLKDQELKDDIYLPWAVEKHQLPLLKSEFFAGFQPNSQLWDSEKSKFNWDEGFIPLFHWEDRLVVGCVDIPEKYVQTQEHVLILCSILELEKIWNFYQAPQSYRFIDQLGIQPVDPQPIPSESQAVDIDALTVGGPSVETPEPVLNMEQVETLEPSVQVPRAPQTQSEEDPAALLELSDEESSEKESSSEDENKESSSEDEEASPEGLSLDSSEDSESLSFDLSVPPPKLSLTALNSNSEESVPAVQSATTPNPTPATPTPSSASPLTPSLSPLLSPSPSPSMKPQATPPPPPPEAEVPSLIAQTTPSVTPTKPPPVSAEAQVIPMKNDRFIHYHLMKELSFSEVQNTVEQIFADYREQNKVGFFGFVDQDKRKIDLAFRSKGTPEALTSSAITVDQPGILNIVLRTQKPFYGKPHSSEQNLKLYDLVNDGIDPDMIMVVPFLLDEKVVALVGFIADEKSYSLDRLMEYEIRVQREFRIKLGLSITNLERAS